MPEVYLAECTECDWSQPARSEDAAHHWIDQHEADTRTRYIDDTPDEDGHHVRLRSAEWEEGEASPEQLELLGEANEAVAGMLADIMGLISRVTKSGMVNDVDKGAMRQARHAFHTDHGHAAHHYDRLAQRARLERDRPDDEEVERRAG